MEFDPDSNPPCYKTKDEVRTFFTFNLRQWNPWSFPSFGFGVRRYKHDFRDAWAWESTNHFKDDNDLKFKAGKTPKNQSKTQ